MSELLTHFQKMQHQCVRYLEPNGYVPFDGKSVPVHDREAQDSLFINDMIYLLDGPEQRAAEAAHAAAIAKLEAENAGYREALQAIMDQDGAEINPSNYNHEAVCALNQNWVECFQIAEAALTHTPC